MINCACMLNYNYVLPLRNLICCDNIHKLLLAVAIKMREISHTRMHVYRFCISLQFENYIFSCNHLAARLPLSATLWRDTSTTIHFIIHLFQLNHSYLIIFLPSYANAQMKRKVSTAHSFYLYYSTFFPSGHTVRSLLQSEKCQKVCYLLLLFPLYFFFSSSTHESSCSGRKS